METRRRMTSIPEEQRHEVPGPIPRKEMLHIDDWSLPDKDLTKLYAIGSGVWNYPALDVSGFERHLYKYLEMAMRKLDKVSPARRLTIISFTCNGVRMSEETLKKLVKLLPRLRELEIVLPDGANAVEKASRILQEYAGELRSLSLCGANTLSSLDRAFGKGFAKLAFLQITAPDPEPAEAHNHFASPLWEGHNLKEINLCFEGDDDYCDARRFAS